MADTPVVNDGTQNKLNIAEEDKVRSRGLEQYESPVTHYKRLRTLKSSINVLWKSNRFTIINILKVHSVNNNTYSEIRLIPAMVMIIAKFIL